MRSPHSVVEHTRLLQWRAVMLIRVSIARSRALCGADWAELPKVPNWFIFEYKEAEELLVCFISHNDH